jgi:hypothetical protein
MTTIDISELTVRQVREIKAMCGAAERKPAEVLPFKVGDAILVRTVTMIDVGRVRAIGRDFIVLEDGGWVADTARFSEMLATGKMNEFERAPSWFLVGRGAICDAFPWDHPLPKVTK